MAVIFLSCSLNGNLFGRESMEKIDLKSSVFSEGGNIPAEYTCDGKDMSPPLAWSGVPQNAQSLAIIADDPDAPIGDWVHWVVYDLPSVVTGFPAHIPSVERLSMGGCRAVRISEGSDMEDLVRLAASTAIFSRSMPWIPF